MGASAATGQNARRVTLLVVTFNSEDRLPGFFESLPRGLADVPDYEVVVADNGSRDRSVDVAKALWPSATIVPIGRNAGYAAGINAAVLAAGPSDAILVLNDDIQLGDHSIRHLLDAIEEPGVGIAVPRLLDSEGELLKSLRREPTLSRALGEAVLGGKRAGKYAALGEVIEHEGSYYVATEADWASGCAWLISRECWDTVGPWDESYFLYAEDIDYALRARDQGFRLRLAPEAIAVHSVGPSHEVPRLWAMSVWNRYRLYRGRHGALRSALFRLSLLLNEALRVIRGRPIHKAGFAALLRSTNRPEEVR